MTPNKYKNIDNILRSFFMFLFAVVFGNSSFALETPVLTCVTVNLSTGNTTLIWNEILDPDVVGISIFSSLDGYGTEIAAVPDALLEFTDIITPVDANSDQICYRLLAYDIDGEVSDTSEITCSIYIEIEDAAAPNLGFVNINIIGGPYDYWANPPPTNYQLYLDTDGDFTSETVEFETINGGSTLLYEVIICPETEHFFNLFLPSTNCLSNIASDIFTDINPPPIPFITSMSVDTTTTPEINLTWDMPFDHPSYSNVGGYIIYQCTFNNGGWSNIAVAQINDPNELFYNIPASETDFSVYNYTVAAFDTCLDDNGEILSPSPTPEVCDNSMVLTNITDPQNTCDFIVLEWNHYGGWAEGWQNNPAYNPGGLVGGLGAYEIFKKENNGTYEAIAFGNSFEFDGLHYHDTIFNINSQSTYNFYIKAHSFDVGYTANSNIYTLNLSSNTGPERTYISSASIASENEIEITIKTDPTLREHEYLIQKRRDTDDVFLDLASIVNDSDVFLSYTDTDVNTNRFSYEYRAYVINHCGDTVKSTNAARTMLCRATIDNVSLNNSLNWTAYNEFDFPVDHYNVYRSTSADDLGEFIGEVSGLSTTYIDQVIDQTLTENLQVPGFFCYTIEAVEKSGNEHDFIGEALSNQVCVQMQPEIYVPNAFILGGINNVFKPVIILADFDQYQMRIYSRSGNMVYETNDYDRGWTGEYNGTELSDGAYGYIISIKDGSGNLHQRSGMVVKLSQ